MSRNPGIAFAPDSSKVYLLRPVHRGVRLPFADRTLRTLIRCSPASRATWSSTAPASASTCRYNKGGGIVKIDITQRRIVDRVSTGRKPRTIVLAPDGRSLYVVDQESNRGKIAAPATWWSCSGS